MSEQGKSKNDSAWEVLFTRYDILNRLSTERCVTISAEHIREYREPRLMAKFDHKINLPSIFSANKLSILPVSRGMYCIAPFDAYFPFEEKENSIHAACLPPHIQSIDPTAITGESVAINCALAAGILADFSREEHLLPTVSGRMGSGHFAFDITDLRDGSDLHLSVHNAQMEIDAALEGAESLLLIEAKNDLSPDFIIRQLYYPYAAWVHRVTKKVRPLFLVYSNSIFSLYEYKFTDNRRYNSIELVGQKNYSIENTRISRRDIEALIETVVPRAEPPLPFPQADSFSRVINMCELLNRHPLSREEITREYAFDVRQTNYYTDAGRYLGLVEKKMQDKEVYYGLTKKGKAVFQWGYRQRQLALCAAILQHRVFMDLFKGYLLSGSMPDREAVVHAMQRERLYHMGRESTYQRRASTVAAWLQWMAGLWGASAS